MIRCSKEDVQNLRLVNPTLLLRILRVVEVESYMKNSNGISLQEVQQSVSGSLPDHIVEQKVEWGREHGTESPFFSLNCDYAQKSTVVKPAALWMGLLRASI